jgi:VWFA-related protein
MTTFARRSRGVTRALALVSMAAVLGLARTEGLGGQQTFRSSVDLIVVDVQVRDKSGRQMDALTPADFQVAIDGRARRVVSADFERIATGAPGSATAGTTELSAGRVSGRTFAIVIDAGSFRTNDANVAVVAAARFIDSLLPSDAVGLYAVPVGPRFEPTTQRTALRQALTGIIGHKREIKGNFDFSAPEVIDITAVMASKARDQLKDDETITRYCSSGLDPEACVDVVTSEVEQAALALEQDDLDGLAGLERLLLGMQTTPERKTVLLLSGGMPMADRGSARPDIGNALKKMGEQAAFGNATIHVVYFDRNHERAASTESRRDRPSNSRMQTVDTKALLEISRSSGGLLLTSNTGGAEAELQRILTESSAYYVLGVEPDAKDRDGRPHRLEVKVKKGGLEVRSRQLVLVPKPKTP